MTAKSAELRVLDALWKARYGEPENDGWTFVLDLLKKVEPNLFGFRMGAGTAYVALARLEADGRVESKWIQTRPESHPYPRRRGYRLTEEGHLDRARQNDRRRSSSLG